MNNLDDRISRAAPAQETGGAGDDPGGLLMWEKRAAPRRMWISLILVILYLVLLVPYLIAVNSGESGIVKEVQAVQAATLPPDIQDLLITKDMQYYMILIEDPIRSVRNANGQIAREKKLVFSGDPAQVNEFIRVDNTLTNFYSPPSIVQINGQTYDTILIGSARKVTFGGVVEVLNGLGLAPLLYVSQFVYLLGGLLLVMFLSYFLGRFPSLWNIPAILTGYSIQFFLAGRIASLNRIETDLPVLFFGLLFLPALFLAIWVRKAENTREGKQLIYSLSRKNVEFFRSMWAGSKKILGIR